METQYTYGAVSGSPEVKLVQPFFAGEKEVRPVLQ